MTIKYTLEEYDRYVRISSQRHILVEGKHDKYIIERLWSDLAGEKNYSNNVRIVIDSAERLIGFSPSIGSNREKVIRTCVRIRDQSFAARFVGFVDREFEQFRWKTQDSLQDERPNHHVEGRLVYARGHSIENYLFEFETFKAPLVLLSMTPQTHQALAQFEQIFVTALEYACAIGLTLAKLGLIQKTERTIDWQLFEVIAEELHFLFEQWTEKLSSERNISVDQIRALKKDYQIYLQLIQKADLIVVRWLCHGHFGFACLYAVYQRCIVDVLADLEDQKKAISNIAWVSLEKMFLSVAHQWIQRALRSECDYPLQIFKMIGFVEASPKKTSLI